MFRNYEKYDLFERKKSRSVNDYSDKLFFEQVRFMHTTERGRNEKN